MGNCCGSSKNKGDTDVDQADIDELNGGVASTQ